MHTPGKWSVLCDEARGRPRCLVVDEHGEVASVNPYRDTWNGNSQLIAAAPELKTMIQTIYDGIHRGVGPMATMSDAEIGHVINDEMSRLLGNDWNEQ